MGIEGFSSKFVPDFKNYPGLSVNLKNHFKSRVTTEEHILRLLLRVSRVWSDLGAMSWWLGTRLLTAFNFKRARLGVQGKPAEVHVAHRSHCNPKTKKTKSRFSEAAKYRCNIIKQTEKASASFQRNFLLLIIHGQCFGI